ncbi:MAG: hypothetical protein U0Z17_08220 [Bacteroidales bacterium]
MYFARFFPGKNISWQSHLLGGLAGILIAFGFRKEGPQRKTYVWEDEDEDDDFEGNEEDEPEDEEMKQQQAGKDLRRMGEDDERRVERR